MTQSAENNEERQQYGALEHAIVSQVVGREMTVGVQAEGSNTYRLAHRTIDEKERELIKVLGLEDEDSDGRLTMLLTMAGMVAVESVLSARRIQIYNGSFSPDDRVRTIDLQSAAEAGQLEIMNIPKEDNNGDRHDG